VPAGPKFWLGTSVCAPSALPPMPKKSSTTIRFAWRPFRYRVCRIFDCFRHVIHSLLISHNWKARRTVRVHCVKMWQLPWSNEKCHVIRRSRRCILWPPSDSQSIAYVYNLNEYLYGAVYRKREIKMYLARRL